MFQKFTRISHKNFTKILANQLKNINEIFTNTYPEHFLLTNVTFKILTLFAEVLRIKRNIDLQLPTGCTKIFLKITKFPKTF